MSSAPKPPTIDVVGIDADDTRPPTPPRHPRAQSADVSGVVAVHQRNRASSAPVVLL